MNKKDLGIYIHIPFCVKKCLYCDFLSDTACTEDMQNYVEALLREIKYTMTDDEKLTEDYRVVSVFFGGGTPSILKGSIIADILNAVKERFTFAPDAEITIECNPGTATAEKMREWIKAGINRLSIGLQSANDDELHNLGRIHDYATFKQTYQMAVEEGFENINVDLMSAIPGQTLESFEHSLEEIAGLNVAHISAYSLIIEEDTPFYDMYGCGEPDEQLPKLVDEDTEREMYYATERILAEYGYHRYEISNYCKDGRECRHNVGYWTGMDYLGLGVGAAGYVRGFRYSNTSDIYVYMNNCRGLGELQNEAFLVSEDDDDEEDVTSDSRTCNYEEVLYSEKNHTSIHKQTRNDRIEEFMFLGLRMMKGISRQEFKSRFGCDIDEIYGAALDKLAKEQMLTVCGDRIMLTKRGIDVSNIVLANFLL